MNFTGERFIPGEGGCQIAYEHLHRYLFALRWAEGREALDLACGTGYGAALLARRARHVWALDIDGETIAGAGRNWRCPNLNFLQGDAARLPFRDGSMELVVAMEALEHIEDQERLLGEIARVCSADGVLLISTPNKAEYTDARKYSNPFHKKELYLDEFAALLKRYFPRVEIAGQHIRAGSLICCNPSGSAAEVFEESAYGADAAVVPPMYYLAVCSPNRLERDLPARSAYLDPADGLILEGKRELAGLGAWGKSLERVIGERDKTIRALQSQISEEVDSRDRVIRALQDDLALLDETTRAAIQELQARGIREVEQRDQTIRDIQQAMQAEVRDRDGRIVELLDLLHRKEQEFDERGQWALSLQAEINRLSGIRRSLLYRILSRIGLLPQ